MSSTSGRESLFSDSEREAISYIEDNPDEHEARLLGALLTEMLDLREKLRAATNMLAEAEKIVPGVIVLSGRMSLFGQSDRERLEAATAALAEIAEPKLVAPRVLRETARTALEGLARA